jgi:hypothetical protein
MQRGAQIAAALAVVLAAALIVVAVRREAFLIYPYLDLDEPGERGSYYALSEGVPVGRPPTGVRGAGYETAETRAAARRAARGGPAGPARIEFSPYARDAFCPGPASAVGGCGGAAGPAAAIVAATGTCGNPPYNLGLYDAPYKYDSSEKASALAWDGEGRCRAFCTQSPCAVWCR